MIINKQSLLKNALSQQKSLISKKVHFTLEINIQLKKPIFSKKMPYNANS